MKFTTEDRDNDRLKGGNCAVYGNYNGWWHNQCSAILLNREYSNKAKVNNGSSWHNYPFIKMKIRLMNCNYNIRYCQDALIKLD